MDENKIIYDWLSFTTKIHTKEQIISMLGLQDVTWMNLNGANGYKDRLYYDKISIHFNGQENMGIWCEMSGQGCRAFETFGSGNYENIFAEIFANKDEMNLTRLDVAYDDFEGYLDLELIIAEIQNQNYLSPFREWQIILGSKGNSILLGSMKSDILIRIYDKARERGFIDGRHWIRLETQIRRKLAENFAYLQNPISEKFVGVLNNYIRFVIPNENDSNKSRWETALWWEAFLDSALKIQIYQKPGTEYNEIRLENYVFNQAGNSIFTYLKCFGSEKFEKMLNDRKTKLNQKQEYLIQKYKNMECVNND